MEKNDDQRGLFKIYIPPSAETKTLDNINRLLTNKDELTLDINQNIYNLTKEQLEYLKYLLSLDISVFENEKLNAILTENPLFFSVARYNLYEGILRTLKQMENIDPSSINVSIGIPDNNWLDIKGHIKEQAFPLIEIVMNPSVREFYIYDSEGYTREYERALIESYKEKKMDNDYIKYKLETNKKKRELIKGVAHTILNYWNIGDFQDNVSYDEKVKGKILSWARVYKQNIDD